MEMCINWPTNAERKINRNVLIDGKIKIWTDRNEKFGADKWATLIILANKHVRGVVKTPDQDLQRSISK